MVYSLLLLLAIQIGGYVTLLAFPYDDIVLTSDSPSPGRTNGTQKHGWVPSRLAVAWGGTTLGNPNCLSAHPTEVPSDSTGDDSR